MITYAVIFDLDGLLADTEKLQIKAYQQVFSEYGMELDENIYAEHWIRNGLGIKEYTELNNIPVSYMELRKRKKQVYQELLENCLQPMPFAVETIQKLFSKRKMAVASASNFDDVSKILGKMGVFELFDTVVCGDQVKNQKPAPDIFIQAARQLNMKPADCIVIEDAEKGIRAAKNAGMKSIAIPNVHTKTNNFEYATYIVKDLSEIEKIIEQIESIDK